MSEALSTILTFIGGGVFVFVATEVANWMRSRHARRLLQQNVRTLLHVEIEHNLTMLRELFNKVTWNVEGTPDELEFQKRTRFASALLPQWGRLMWESQAVHLPEVFTQDFIQRIYQFYTHLDDLTTSQAALKSKVPPHLAPDYEAFLQYNRESIARRTSPSQLESWADYPKMQQFLADTGELWRRSYGLMNGLLTSGNPVSLTTGEPWATSISAQISKLRKRVRSPITPAEDVKTA